MLKTEVGILQFQALSTTYASSSIVELVKSFKIVLLVDNLRCTSKNVNNVCGIVNVRLHMCFVLNACEVAADVVTL